ncbi:L-threonylcarbamoyladenylate synthase [Chloroflexota bacterium]
MQDKIPAGVRRQVEQGIGILKQGGIIAFPTDTVYGLGACFDLVPAVERIYQVKGRLRTAALPLLLSDASQIGRVAHSVPPVAWRMAAGFWPGALTLVLHKSSPVPDIITASGGTVAVRVPDHPVPVALITGAGVPIVGTSANLSGRPSPLTAGEVWAQFGDRVDLIIDGGPCPGGRESTIVDVTGERPMVLREGVIPAEEIRRVWEYNIRGKGLR